MCPKSSFKKAFKMAVKIIMKISKAAEKQKKADNSHKMLGTLIQDEREREKLSPLKSQTQQDSFCLVQRSQENIPWVRVPSVGHNLRKGLPRDQPAISPHLFRSSDDSQCN